jgi:hypothetical protein
VKNEIRKFVAKPNAEVLCIRGKWGVGKTFTWTTELTEAQQHRQVALDRYSYVSLFGVNSLVELKAAIFENVIELKNGIKKPDLNTLDEFVSTVSSWRKLTRLGQSIPFVSKFIGNDLTGVVTFMTIRDQIICIDDLERRGQKLDIGDVLGLISYLREQRNCKVVLILNDEQLKADAKKDFEKSLEKVADISVTYEPAVSESVAIAIKATDELHKTVAERCTALGITNIRVINRAVRYVEVLAPLLAEYQPDVCRTAISSLVLFSWANDQPEAAPTLNFLENKSPSHYRSRRDGEMPPSEAAWNALLDSYGYVATDDLDRVLIESVRKGYFNPDKLKIAAQALNAQIIASKADGSFDEAWRKYHDSFDNDQKDVLDGLYASFMANARYISPTNLNGTVSLFKELGEGGRAKEMLDHYMIERADEGREFFDLDDSLFGGNVTDGDVRAAFAEKSKVAEEKRDVAALLLSIKDGWDDDRIAALSTSPVDEYRKAFKSHVGKDLRSMLSNAFQFDRIVNASDQMRAISLRAREALKEIGQESPINARRVRRFGIQVEPKSSTKKVEVKVTRGTGFHRGKANKQDSPGS